MATYLLEIIFPMLQKQHYSIIILLGGCTASSIKIIGQTLQKGSRLVNISQHELRTNNTSTAFINLS